MLLEYIFNIVLFRVSVGTKVENHSVIVSKAYTNSSSNPSTPSYRGFGHSITRLTETEKSDNQPITNHFYSKLNAL